MRGSVKLFSVRGIDVRLHYTFLLLVAYFAIAYGSRWGVRGAWFGVAIILTVFLCIVLHELGHSIVAQNKGVHVSSITLFPFGGMAAMATIPEEPGDEFRIAISGPMVNFAIAIFLHLIIPLKYKVLMNLGFKISPTTLWGFLEHIKEVNLIIGAFNLIPAFPMDGGRILRALLARKMEYMQATRIAVVVGQSFAFLFALWGIVAGHIILLIVALFVYLGAEQEGMAVALRQTLRQFKVADVLPRVFHVVKPDETLGDVINWMLHHHQDNFPVVEEGAVVGVLQKVDILRGLHEKGMGCPVRDVMREDYLKVPAGMPLGDVLDMLAAEEADVALVLDDEGQLAGLISVEDISKIYGVLSATKALSKESG